MSSTSPSTASAPESTAEQADSVTKDVDEYLLLGGNGSSIADLKQEQLVGTASTLEDSVPDTPLEFINPPSVNEVTDGATTALSGTAGTDAVETVLALLDERQQTSEPPDLRSEVEKLKDELIKKNRAPHNKVSVPVQVFQMQDPNSLDSAGESQLKFKPKNNATYIEFPHLLDGFLLVSFPQNL
jgi:hypothetical protein